MTGALTGGLRLVVRRLRRSPGFTVAAVLTLALGIGANTTDLYGVRPQDPLTFAFVAFILLGAAVIACAIPARRASRIDPVVALRSE